MNDKYFVDTNILVYAFDSSEPDKRQIAQNLLGTLGSQGYLTVSTQVLQEFFVTVTRKLKFPLSAEIAYEVVENLAYYPLIQVEPSMILAAIRRYTADAVSFWDALIIDAALQSNCTILLSEDMQDGKIVADQLVIQNPFKST